LAVADHEGDGVGGGVTLDGNLDVSFIDGFDVEDPDNPTGSGLKPWRLGGPTSTSDRDMFSVLTATGVLDGEFFELKQRKQVSEDEDASPVPDVEARYEWRVVYDTDNQYDSDLANKYPIFDSGSSQDSTNQPWISDAESLKEVVLVLEDTLIAHYKLDDQSFYGPGMERIKDSAWEDHHADFDNYGVGTEWVTQAKHDGGLKFTPRTGYQDQARIESPDRDDEDPPKPGLDIGYGDLQICFRCGIIGVARNEAGSKIGRMKLRLRIVSQSASHERNHGGRRIKRTKRVLSDGNIIRQTDCQGGPAGF
jgi:hypothetical protein